MMRDDAVTRMRRYLGFNPRLDTAILVDALKDAQQELENRPELPWFLITEVATISTTQGESRVALPADFIREYEQEALYIYDSSEGKWTPLEKRDADQLRKKFKDDSDSEDEPKFYALDGSYYRLYPVPDAVYTLKSVYYAQDTVLDSDVENNWLKFAPNLMIGLAGMFVTKGTRDQQAKMEFQELAQLGGSQLDREMEARDTANRRYVMGGSD